MRANTNTASIFFDTYQLNDHNNHNNYRLSSAQKSKTKKYQKKQIIQSSQSQEKKKNKNYINLKDCDNQNNMKGLMSNFSKTKSYSNTRRNSINFSQEKVQKKQSFKSQIKKNQHHQITKNLEIEAKNYLKFLKQLFNTQSSINKHEKIRINQWIAKLQLPMHNDVWRQNRNFYLKVLVEMIAFGVISEPFSNVPADGQLPKLTIYDIAFPIRQRLLQQKNETTNQKTRQKSRKNSLKHSTSKTNKENNPHIGNMLQERNFKNINRNLYQQYEDSQISVKKIKAGTKFQFDSTNHQNKQSYDYNKINFLSNTSKNQNHINRQSSVQMVKRKIFNEIENFSSINKNQVSSSALINDSEESEFGYYLSKNQKKSRKNSTKKEKVFHTMKTEEFMKTSVQEEEKYEYQNKYQYQQQQKQKQKQKKYRSENIQKGLNIISELELMLWQKQKNFKNNENQQYQTLMTKISKLLNKANKQTFQQSRSNVENKQNNSSISNVGQSLDISKLFKDQSQSNSFKVLSQKMKSKFNKTGKDTKQFLDFLRSYH